MKVMGKDGEGRRKEGELSKEDEEMMKRQGKDESNDRDRRKGGRVMERE